MSWRTTSAQVHTNTPAWSYSSDGYLMPVRCNAETSIDGGPLHAGTLVLWTFVVFVLMLCTFGIGAASGEWHLHSTFMR